MQNRKRKHVAIEEEESGGRPENWESTILTVMGVLLIPTALTTREEQGALWNLICEEGQHTRDKVSHLGLFYLVATKQ